jgi:hypothetical protein
VAITLFEVAFAKYLHLTDQQKSLMPILQKGISEHEETRKARILFQNLLLILCLSDSYQRFRRTYCFHIEGRDASSLKMEIINCSALTLEAKSSSEVLIPLKYGASCSKKLIFQKKWKPAVRKSGSVWSV